jgi:prolyl 4-hydroxylase
MVQRTTGACARAEGLATLGRVAEALHVLQQAAAIGDADALFALGLWRLRGDRIPRKLSESREFFRRAAAAGNAEAATIFTAFLANGTGGAPLWQGALRLLQARASTEPAARRQLEILSAMGLEADGSPKAVPNPRHLSTSPHVQLFPALFSPAECAYLVEMAEPLMQPAVIVHPQTGAQMRNPVRTSDSAAFPLTEENPAIHALNRRIAAASGTDVLQGEPLQVLRYRPGQEYKPHSDALPGESNQRVATMLVYLSDNYEGGETHFLANDVRVRGRVGDGLLFRNVDADGLPDKRASHAGLPVTNGSKLIASRWIRAKPLQLEPG